MSMLSSQYKIDSIVINKNLVQSMMRQSPNTYPTTTISQVFNLCDNLVDYDDNPNDKTIKIQIKDIMQQGFMNRQFQNRQVQKINQYKINLSQVYMLNKPGNFGRVLERKCRFVEKGVMQYEQGKQAKLKEVKSFLNKIQHVQNKQLADLTWLSTQPQKYKFRIILYDNNQNNKGIYFETYQQAQSVRAYLVYKYKKKTINNQVFSQLKYKLIESTVNELVKKIKYKKLITKINQDQKPKQQNKEIQKISKNSSQIKLFGGNEIKLNFNSKTGQKQQQFNYQQYQQKNILVGKQQKPITTTKKSYMTGFLDDLINQHNKNQNMKLSNKQSQKSINLSKISLKNNNSNLQIFNESCRNEFFLKWRDLAVKKRNRFPTNKSTNFLQDQQSQIQKSIVKINDQQIKTSKKVQSSSRVINKQQKPSSIISPYNQFDDYEESQENPFALPITINGQNVSSAQSSPIKQSSRINKVLAHSRKQQSIFKLPKTIQQEENLSQTQKHLKNHKKIGTQKILFKSVQFMDHSMIKNTNSNNKQNADDTNKDKKKANSNLMLFKPIVTITIQKNKKKQQNSTKQKHKNPRNRIQQQNLQQSQQQQTKKGEYIFNTMIKKSYRTMQYELVPTQGQGVFETTQSMNNMYIILTVTNFLTNEEILQSMFEFNEFAFVRYGNTIVDKQGKMKMKFQYQSTGVAEPQTVYNNNQNSESSLFFSIPKIDPEIIKKIKTYWQTQAISNSYYNLQDNFNIFDAVSNSSNDAQPKNWWLDLDQKQYNYLCILNSSSVILGYKLCQPMLYIIKAVKNIHFKIQKIIEMLLSIILNLGNYYYFPQNLNKVNYLHRQVGLSKGNIDFENRIFLQVLLFEKFLAFQCPQLNEKLQRRNIAISHIMLEYTYELFSRNFGIEVLCEYWSYCAEDIQKVPLIFFLTTISLCRLLSDKLLRCNRLAEIKEVFQSKKIRSSTILLNDLKQLRGKYFSKGQGFIEQIKQAFQQKPFENVLNIYYKRLSDNEARMKRDKVRYKHELCSKVLQYVQPQQALDLFTKYIRQPKKYTLHIYFYQLPQTEGKFLICTGQTKYQTLTVSKSRYFIIGQVTSKVQIKFIDYQGNTYYGQLVMNQGFNQFKVKLVNDNTQDQYELHYLCGLLTDNQIELIKANKKFAHFMGPNITLELFKDELLRPLKQVRHTQSWMTQEWFRDLRIIFSHGNKLFSQVAYFMNLLKSENITHQQKINKIKQFSLQISRQYFLCDNHIVYKQLLYEFYKMTFIPLKQQDFQCYFSDSLQLEFQAPKILKCRFVTQNKEIKLEKQLNQYWSKKCFTHLYGDMFIDEILALCQKHLRPKIPSSLTDGELKILYSTFGNIELKVIPLKLQNKKLLIDYDKQTINESVFHQIAQKQPQLLMTEVLPSFTKISTILDYVNSSKNIDLRARSKQTMQKKVIPQTINLLKYAQNRMKNCLLLRYESFPSVVKIPFYSYFSELIMNPDIPKFQHYYFNNIKNSIKSICLSRQQLRFSSNNKQQHQQFDKSIGLYGNLRKLQKFGNQINTVFFWTESKEDHSVPKSLVWVNYGYGVGRWEYCIIKQYRKMLKRRNKNSMSPKSQNKRKEKEQNNKIQYLVQKGRHKFYVRDYQVKLNPGAKEYLSEIRNQLEKEFFQSNNDIKNSLSLLINPSSLNEFVKSLKNKG